MVEYCVYWLENGEPMHEVFSSLAAAEMYLRLPLWHGTKTERKDYIPVYRT